AVFATTLHSLRGHSPNAFGQVNFVPSAAQDFTGPRRCENCELQGGRRNAGHFPQLLGKCGHVIERHSPMMPAREFLALGQQGVEVPAPPGGVLTGTHPARLGEV
ncbi:MAG TPA: hypothetical protein VLC74_12725, partial [Rhizomicrobium sp.]|nr:hypothetical protein [Rhizomicrobium sp.]